MLKKISLFIALTCAILSFACCTRNRSAVNVDRDSLYVAKIVNQTMAPSFNNAEALADYRNVQDEASYDDYVFLTMNHDMIIRVARVVIKNDGFVTKRSLVSEYLSHKDIYDAQAGPKEKLPDVPDTPPDTTDTIEQ